MSVLQIDITESLLIMDDVAIDRLYVSLGHSYTPNRAEKVSSILAYPDKTKLERNVKHFLKAFDQSIPDVGKGIKKEPPTHDPVIAVSYARHNSFEPLALYLRSFGMSVTEILGHMSKYFHDAKSRIPSEWQLETLLNVGHYQLDNVTHNEQFMRIAECCKKHGLSGYDIFYDPLYFDRYNESQNGWGVTLSAKDKERYGYGMISGDTVGDICSAIASTTRKNPPRRP